MPSTAFQVTGLLLALIGWLGTIVACGAPLWKVTEVMGTNMLTAFMIWEGLWLECVTQSTGQVQCTYLDNILELSVDLQAAQAMVVVCVLAGLVGVVLATLGAKCTTCMEDEVAKARTSVMAGVLFIVAAILVLIPSGWVARAIVQGFYDPMVPDSERRELGPALYISWGSALLMVMGGGMLCNSCPPKENRAYVGAKYVSSVREYV